MKSIVLAFLVLLLVQGCSSTPVNAPVSTRSVKPEPEPTVSSPSTVRGPRAAAVTQPATPVSRPLARNAHTYSVRHGDTLYSVAWQHGLEVGELARLNHLQAPWTIYPGQQLRIRSGGRPTAPVRSRPVPRPAPADRAPATPPATPPAEKAATKTTPKQQAKVAKVPATTPDFDGNWSWPTRGRLQRGFQPNATGKKGIYIAGHYAQPVRAAASGKVVYSDSGLPGYGRLIIVKHNDNLLSAYGHNSKLLVEEGDLVKRGDQIAKMGNSGNDRTALYFEIRKGGKPVNPMHYLPRN